MPVCRFCDHDVPASARNCPACGAEVTAGDLTNDAPDLEQQLLDLIDHGRQIDAIKHYRDATGAGLAEAKAAIDTLAATRSLPPGNANAANGDIGFETELLNLLSAGNKIGAVKLYRDRTGSGLKEAKEAVEALATRHGLAPKGPGCLGVLLLAAATGLLLAAI